MIGRSVSHYRVIEIIGRGGMGVVYRAEDTKLGRPVALKFLSSGSTGDPEATERFIQEARAASALDHPGICTIHEIDETPERDLFICMALYAGQSLRKRMKRGPPSPGRGSGRSGTSGTKGSRRSPASKRRSSGTRATRRSPTRAA